MTAPLAAAPASATASAALAAALDQPVPTPQALQPQPAGGIAHDIVRTLSSLDPWMPFVLALLVMAALAVAAGIARRRPRWPSARPYSVGPAGALAALMAACGAALAWAVHTGAPAVLRLDAAAFALADAWAGPAMRWWAVVLSDVGDVLSLTIVSVIAVALLLARRRPWLAWGTALAIGINSTAVRVLKNAFERDRPAGAAEWLTSGHSFPSGHAAGSLMVVGLLAWLLCRGLPPGWRWLIGAVALALVLGIGTARVVLHVHYASDVLGGWLLAGAILVLAVAALRPAADARI